MDKVWHMWMGTFSCRGIDDGATFTLNLSDIYEIKMDVSNLSAHHDMNWIVMFSDPNFFVPNINFVPKDEVHASSQSAMFHKNATRWYLKSQKIRRRKHLK